MFWGLLGNLHFLFVGYIICLFFCPQTMLKDLEREQVVGRGVNLRLELKQDLYQQKPHCPKCNIALTSHGFGLPSYSQRDIQIINDPDLFRSAVLKPDLNLAQRWAMIAEPLIRRYRHYEYGPDCDDQKTTSRRGPYATVGKWSAPLLVAIYGGGYSFGNITRLIGASFGEGPSNATMWRSINNIVDAGELKHQDEKWGMAYSMEEIKALHDGNALNPKKSRLLIRGEWDLNMPPVAWRLWVEVDINQAYVDLLEAAAQASENDERAGKLEFTVLTQYEWTF